jgi:hypothetical protein
MNAKLKVKISKYLECSKPKFFDELKDKVFFTEEENGEIWFPRSNIDEYSEELSDFKAFIELKEIFDAFPNFDSVTLKNI